MYFTVCGGPSFLGESLNEFQMSHPGRFQIVTGCRPVRAPNLGGVSEIIMNGLYIYKCQRFYVHKTQLLFTIAIANAIAIANTNIQYTTERYTGIYTQKMVYRNTQ